MTAIVAGVELRPSRPADEQVLRRMYASTRASEMALLPWTDAEKQAFCDMQFDAQDAHYRAHHAAARFDVVLVDGEAAGRITVDRSADRVHVVDVVMLPEFRGRGVATALLEALQAEAAEARLPLVLEVEVGNRAADLYRRLGFEVTGAMGFHHEMTWRAAGQ